MSLILEALKKSEAERRLGQVPSLNTLPVMRAQPRRRGAWWLLVPLMVLTGAVVWSNRDLLGLDDAAIAEDDATTAQDATRQVASSEAIGPQAPDEVPDQSAVAVAAQDRVAPVLLTPRSPPSPATTQSRPMPQPLATQPAQDELAAMEGISPENQRRIRNGELFVPNPALLSERGPTEVDQIVDAESLLPPPLPEPDAIEGMAPSEQPEVETPSTPPQAPAAVAAPPQVEVSPTVTAARPVAAATDTMTIHDLSLAQRQGLPALRMSMHVYHADVARRFAIIDGHRVNEGGVIGQETWAREIVPDGVIVEYRNLRFLLPRVGS